MLRVAFKMLFHDRAKFLALIIGIAFSALLISQQSAIFDSVLEQAVQPIRAVPEAEVWVLKNGVEVLDECEIMPEACLYRVRSVRETAKAVPYYMGIATLKSTCGRSKSVQFVSCDGMMPLAAPSDNMLEGSPEILARPGAAIMDMPGFHQLFPGREPIPGMKVEVNGQRLSLDGFCKVPPNWSGLPIMFVSMKTAGDIMNSETMPMGAILVKPVTGYSAESTAAAIREKTGLQALTAEDFARRTIEWVVDNTGVAENFGVTIILGIIIGVAIVGQTFYLFSVENIKQFAAMKAIGVGNPRILAMIVFQAIYVAVIGYSLGIGCANVFFAVVNPGNGGMRGMFMSCWILAGTGAFIVVITLVACLFCVRKVLTVDPAEVFRS
ncbi:MAG: ABC transporter permease [Victivallaceae bacterium]|nr:ABC transporter permease [Victivallaceae bacterium]